MLDHKITPGPQTLTFLFFSLLPYLSLHHLQDIGYLKCSLTHIYFKLQPPAGVAAAAAAGGVTALSVPYLRADGRKVAFVDHNKILDTERFSIEKFKLHYVVVGWSACHQHGLGMGCCSLIHCSHLLLSFTALSRI